MLRIGEKIPEMVLDAYQDDETKFIKLSSYRGKWLVLLFYPADFTFVCPTSWKPGAKTLKPGLDLVGKL